MDKRICAAATALPKLEPLIDGFIEHSSPAELSCVEEEVFYDPKTSSIYVALLFDSKLDEKITQTDLIVGIPNLDGPLEILDSATLLEKDLEDITHEVPHAILQVLRNRYINLKLQAALTTSSLLLHKTCDKAQPKLK